MKLSDNERCELHRMAGSSDLRRDMRYLRENRLNPLLAGEENRLDRLIEFLNQYNEFINHTSKPFSPMRTRNIKM